MGDADDGLVAFLEPGQGEAVGQEGEGKRFPVEPVDEGAARGPDVSKAARKLIEASLSRPGDVQFGS